MKMPLRVYNRFLDLQGETDSYQSLQYERDYHGVGTFELHINRYMHGADNLQKGSIIALNKQTNKGGIIVSREIDLDENGKESENFKITGLTLDSIMNRRITVPPSHTSHDRKSGDAETVMKHYVYNHFVKPVDPSRKLDMLEIALNQNRGEHVEWESRFKNIGEELENISIQSGLGWGIFVDFNTKKFIFDCFQAKNLTQNNEFGYSPVFFSPEFETIKSLSFIESDNDYKNVGYVGGQGEGVERKIVTIGKNSGWNRIETFVDARDVGTEDEESEEGLTAEEIEKLLTDRGKKKMKEMETIFSLEAEILTPVKRATPFQYEKDFDLGDRVQVVNKSWGLTMTAPITKFLEVHEPGGFRLEATFGQTRPTLITKIKEKFDELKGIEKQEFPAMIAVEKMKEAMRYGDKNLTEEEKKRIEQAMKNLEEAKRHAIEYADQASKESEEAMKKYADAQDELERIKAESYADGKVTEEEKRAIKDAQDKLEEAKEDADRKAKAAEQAANKYASEQDKIVEANAKEDAKKKADAAQTAAEAVAEAKARLAEERAIANADGKVSAEERARIKQAEDNLAAAKADAQIKADAAKEAANKYASEQDKIVESNAKADAKKKADAAQSAAEKVAEAKAELAKTEAIANADGKITKEEQARIKQAQENLSAAKAEAKAKADAAERAANSYSETQDNKVRDDAKGYASDAERNAKDFSKDASNIMEGILDVGAVPIRTSYSGARISFDGINGFVQYDKNDNPVAWFDLNGNARFSGDITGASGIFGDVTVKNGDFTLEDDVSGLRYNVSPQRNLIVDHSFELVMTDGDKFDSNSIKYNWIEMKMSDNIQDNHWTKAAGKPMVATMFAPDSADAIPVFGEKAISVRQSDYITQNVCDGVGAGTTYTLSGHFKRQWNVVEGAKPRFEVWHLDGATNRITKLADATFSAVSRDYLIRRHATTFAVPSNYAPEDSLEIKISTADSEWAQCDGVQLIRGSSPSVYQPEDSVWRIAQGKYSINNRQSTLWIGAIYLNAEHKVVPNKPLDLCLNGWVMEWSYYKPGEGATDSDWQYSYIPKGAASHRGGHRRYLRSGNTDEVFKYFYIFNDYIQGHDLSQQGVNRGLVLRAVYEF